MNVTTRPPRADRPPAGGATRWRRLSSLYSSSVGRKYVMALSGLAIVGFVVVHLIGTLKFFLGPDATNEYGEALRNLGGDVIPRTHLLWTARAGLVIAFAVHVHAAFSLDRRNRRANGPARLSRQDHLAATYASRTMLWSGIIVGLFMVFHLADLAWGTIHPDFVRGDAYNNQIASFQRPGITVIYLLGVVALSTHLFHGLWSMLQSLGISSTLFPETTRRRAAVAIATTIGLGYASVPIAVLAGLFDYTTRT